MSTYLTHICLMFSQVSQKCRISRTLYPRGRVHSDSYFQVFTWYSVKGTKLFFFFGAFSPAQMRRTRKISCQKHLSWASLITQMWLRWKELLHKVGLQWFSRQQWPILRGTEHLGKSQEIFISFFLCDVLRGIPLRAPRCCTFRKIFLCYSLRRNPPGHWVILILSGQKSCTRVI